MSETTATSSTGTTGIPRRYGCDLVEGRRQAETLRRLIKGDPSPGTAQWQAIGASLNHGDPAMDRLVEWMHREGGPDSRRLFMEALAVGIEQVAEAPAELREFFHEIEARPDWVDPALLLEGARVCGISGLTGLRVLRDLGLMAGYQAGAINQTLVLTGTLEKGAQRRVAETTKWWIDVTRPGGMERGAAGWRSTLQVRMIHAHVRRALLSNPQWDRDELGLPVNQCDMHATWLAFSVIFLFGQRLMGVILTSPERAAVMHLWRYIGWLMGVAPSWLTDNEMQGRIALYRNLLGQAPADASSRQLGRALMDEPLTRHYPSWAWIRGRWTRAVHLSIERAFLGQTGMRALGLPENVLPWYPLLTFVPRLAWHGLHRLVPGGRERLIERGGREQSDYLDVLFGAERPDILPIKRAEGFAGR